MSKIILTGDRPTGRLHVGHYVGSLKERVALQNSGNYDKVFIMIADAQALTDNAEHPEKVRQNIMQVALDYLSCGIDPNKSCIFIVFNFAMGLKKRCAYQYFIFAILVFDNLPKFCCKGKDDVFQNFLARFIGSDLFENCKLISPVLQAF